MSPFTWWTTPASPTWQRLSRAQLNAATVSEGVEIRRANGSAVAVVSALSKNAMSQAPQKLVVGRRAQKILAQQQQTAYSHAKPKGKA